mmetsp:Transcript_25810/g.72272  ORF Transcript_25810/g.72272 Transcript_25810/m.72272 type:complete len:309 (-) Transcript_25810:538-1464(-)
MRILLCIKRDKADVIIAWHKGVGLPLPLPPLVMQCLKHCLSLRFLLCLLALLVLHLFVALTNQVLHKRLHVVIQSEAIQILHRRLLLHCTNHLHCLLPLLRVNVFCCVLGQSLDKVQPVPVTVCHLDGHVDRRALVDVLCYVNGDLDSGFLCLDMVQVDGGNGNWLALAPQLGSTRSAVVCKQQIAGVKLLGAVSGRRFYDQGAAVAEFGLGGWKHNSQLRVLGGFWEEALGIRLAPVLAVQKHRRALPGRDVLQLLDRRAAAWRLKELEVFGHLPQLSRFQVSRQVCCGNVWEREGNPPGYGGCARA